MPETHHAPDAIAMISTAFGVSGYSRSAPAVEMIFNFEDFEAALSMLPWKQKDDEAGPRDETGQRYFQLTEWAYARSGDVAQITGVVLRKAFGRLLEYVDNMQLDRQPPGGDGVIHWRIRPEFECLPYFIVTEYRSDGPDRCASTYWPCAMDKDWVLVKVYARLSFVPNSAKQ